jgi:hypothetical protein
VHALAAAYRAVTDLLNSRIRSRNLHSEIVFALSPNNNVWVRLFSTATSSRLHVTATALKVRLFMSSSKPSVIMPDLNIILLMYEISTIECRTCSQKYLAIFWNLSVIVMRRFTCPCQKYHSRNHISIHPLTYLFPPDC